MRSRKSYTLLFLLSFLPGVALWAQSGMAVVTPRAEQACDSLLANQDWRGAEKCLDRVYRKDPLGGAYGPLLDVRLALGDTSAAIKQARRQAERWGGSRPSYYVDWIYLSEIGRERGPDWSLLDGVIRDQPFAVRDAALRLEHYGQLQRAVDLYALAESLQPNVNTAVQRAQLHGQLGQYPEQYRAYLDGLDQNRGLLAVIQARWAQNLSTDPEGPHNAAAKAALMERLDRGYDPVMERLLLYVYRQEGSFDLAFRYLKSVGRREGVRVPELFELAREASEDGRHGLAEEVFAFLMEHPGELRRQGALGPILVARSENRLALPGGAAAVSTWAEEFPLGACDGCPDWELFRSWHQFSTVRTEAKLAWYLTELEKIRSQFPNDKVAGRTYFRSGNAQLYLGQFDLALMDYARSERLLGDHPEGDQARLQKALMAFYRGDIAWAKTQLEVLLQSTSKTIANDALENALLISANSVTDTAMEGLQLLRVPMRMEAQGELDSARAAYLELENLLMANEVYDDLLYKLGRLLLRQGEVKEARSRFTQLTRITGDNLWREEGTFYLARCAYDLRDPDAAALLEDYLIQFPVGLYSEEARRLYRTLAP